jgi:MATE family multidrug resistance protein
MTSFSLHRFTKGRNREILNLALPNILTNISVPLLSSVDTAVVGHLREIYYLGAIAIGSMIFGFMVVFY